MRRQAYHQGENSHKIRTVCARIITSLLLMAAASGGSFPQNVPPSHTAAPRIVINLPVNIAPEAVWVRYTLYGPKGSGRISGGSTLKLEPKSRHYDIVAVFDGAPAWYAKVVMYAPGCQFATYDLDLSSGSDITEQFQCESLSTKTVHGFLPPNDIPTNTYFAEKKLDVVGYLDGNWVCRFFLQQRHGETIIEAGSCLGSVIPLGTIGQIDPAQGGVFEMTLPDFTCDPVFGRFGSSGKFGVIQLALKEKKTGRGLATITANDAPEFGLTVQGEYPEPVMFRPVRF
jgi:hypothetical protein